MTLNFAGEKDKLANWEVYLLEFERQETTLAADITNTATAVSAADVGDFPNQGYIRIGNEVIYYGTKSGDTPGCFESARGVFQTTAASAASGDAVVEAFDKYWATKINLISGGLELSNDRAVLNFPKGLKSSVEPDEGKADIGGISIDMVDANNVVSKLLSTIPMRDRTATLWAGYENLPASAFEKEFVGLVKGWKPENEMREFKLSMADMRRTYRQGLFTQVGKCKLSASASNSATVFNVTSTAAASAGDRKFTDPACGYDIETYIKINNEIIGPVSAMAATTISSTGRGSFGTTAAAHSKDDDVDEIFVVDSRNPITFLLQVLTSTGATGSNGTYDVLPSHCGFAIASAYIDVDTFETERDDWTSTYNIAFFVEGTVEDGKAWIESEILRVVGGYMITLRDGRISLRMYHRQALADSQILTTDDIIGKPQWNPSHANIINQLQVFYSKRPTDGAYREIYWEINADSISKHGASPIIEVAFDGVHGDWSLLDPLLDGNALMKDYASRILTRYADPAPVISLKLRHKHRNINPGDLIAITHADFPNLAPASGSTLTGRGVQLEEYEVTGRKMVYRKDESYIDIDAQRAIYAEGAAKYINYFYRLYNYNSYQSIYDLLGAAIDWISGHFTLTANKIRLRCLLSRGTALGTNSYGTIRGRLKTSAGNIITSDSGHTAPSIVAYPGKAWYTFEFTIGAEVGEDIQWIGINRFTGGDSDNGISWWKMNTDEVPETRIILFNNSGYGTQYEYDNWDFTADVAEILV